MPLDVTAFVERVKQEINRRRHAPEATYRLQFHAGFTFRDAQAIVAYLAELGVTDCYSSPYLKARPGSQHGYDVTDHSRLNPEVGSDEDHAAFCTALEKHSLGQILDVVPNHMGVLGNENAMWNNLLENGPASPYASVFDVDWYASPRPELRGRILLPVLGEPYGKTLEAGQLRLTFAGGAFTLYYFDNRFPITPLSYGLILGSNLEELETLLGPEATELLEYQSILTAIKNLPPVTVTRPEKVAEQQREKEIIKRRLAALTEKSQAISHFIETIIQRFNGTPGDPRSFDLLDTLLDRQPYRLSYWRVAADEINYRRFFDINELAALSMEREEVFVAAHELILKFLAQGCATGLRIDHPDGLYDPEQYLRRLQHYYIDAIGRKIHAADPEFSQTPWAEWQSLLRAEADQFLQPVLGPPAWPLYVVVEKILGIGEPLPENWATHGTSGYDFLNYLNGLFVDSAHANEMTRIYQEWIGERTLFSDMVVEKKLLILQIALSSELQLLAFQLDRLAQKYRDSRDFTLNSLRLALRAVIAYFPVYRSYITEAGVSERDRKYVLRAVRLARQRNPALSSSLFDFLRDMLLLKVPETATEDDRKDQLYFIGKFQQLTSPVMAKGMEDTAFYVYNRLLSLNEVGGDPSRLGISPSVLHRYFQERQASWPRAFSSLATHDTKRGEDMRARLNVLSELPLEWQQFIASSTQLNQSLKVTVEDQTVPDANEEYFIYQTLVGAWPLEMSGPEAHVEFVQRIVAYVNKALHEAKVHSSWINPNPPYDQAMEQFVTQILDPNGNQPFLDELRGFAQKISTFGLFNSLAQTLLKITAPGVPDTYQGTELWDFSLVDPDNRRPVNYAQRRDWLDEMKSAHGAGGESASQLLRRLLDQRLTGQIKLFLVWQALSCRRQYPGLFAEGDYIPLEIRGPQQDNLFGFVRRHGNNHALVLVPRLLTQVMKSADVLPLGQVWMDTFVLLPPEVRFSRWQNRFTGQEVACRDQEDGMRISVTSLLQEFPVALLCAQIQS